MSSRKKATHGRRWDDVKMNSGCVGVCVFFSKATTQSNNSKVVTVFLVGKKFRCPILMMILGLWGINSLST